MITEDYVSFETAKLLKEKGFNVPLWFYYDSNEELGLAFWSGWEEDWNNCLINNEPTPFISAPTHQMVVKWLRREHNLHVFTIPVFEDVEYQPGEWQEEMTGYRYEIVNINPNSKIIKDYPKIRALTSESAYEAAIKYCLENLI